MRLWYILPVIVVLIVNSVGLTMIYHRIDKFVRQYPPQALDAVRFSTAETAAKLTYIQDQLALLQLPDDTSVLGDAALTPSGHYTDLLPGIPDPAPSSSLRYISVTDDVTDSVLIYKEHADFSPVIGQLIPGQKYPLSGRFNNWYQINLSGNNTGWVQAAHVHENL